jgi:hypothetical protein
MQPFGTHYSVTLCLREQTALFRCDLRSPEMERSQKTAMEQLTARNPAHNPCRCEIRMKLYGALNMPRKKKGFAKASKKRIAISRKLRLKKIKW